MDQTSLKYWKEKGWFELDKHQYAERQAIFHSKDHQSHA